MTPLIDWLLALAGLIAAGAVAAMCLVGLVVWLAGGRRAAGEAWRGADKP